MRQVAPARDENKSPGLAVGSGGEEGSMQGVGVMGTGRTECHGEGKCMG